MVALTAVCSLVLGICYCKSKSQIIYFRWRGRLLPHLPKVATDISCSHVRYAAPSKFLDNNTSEKLILTTGD